MKKTDQVSIIIGTHNQYKALERCLNSIFCFTSSGYQMILVLNEVGEETKKIVNKFSSLNEDTIIIKNLKNDKNFSKWNNEAVKLADRKYVLYLNDDTFVSWKWLESMVNLFESTHTCGAVGKVLEEEERTIKIPTGTCLLVRREDAWFDPAYYGGYYYEDLDLIKRLRKKGLKVIMETEYPISHVGRSTSEIIPEIKEKQAINEKIFNNIWKPLTFRF